MSGQVKPGEFLRLEHLAETLGVSVTPVREALVSLRGQGFVVLQPRKGYVVAPLSRQDVLDVFRIQADIAGELAARAAAVITPEQLAALEEVQAQLDALPSTDADQAEWLNHRFHRGINTVSESRKLAWFLETAVRYAPLRFYGEIHGWAKATVDDHHHVLDALRDRDAEKARGSMHHHISHAGELLVEHLGNKGLWSA